MWDNLCGIREICHRKYIYVCSVLMADDEKVIVMYANDCREQTHKEKSKLILIHLIHLNPKIVFFKTARMRNYLFFFYINTMIPIIKDWDFYLIIGNFFLDLVIPIIKDLLYIRERYSIWARLVQELVRYLLFHLCSF